MSEELLILSIGPVQGFIAQARRAADLYAGSQLLTRLVGTAIDVIGADNVLYPRRVETKHPQSLPNKLIARMPAGQAQSVAQEAEKKIRETWQQVAKPVRGKLDGWAAVDEEWQKMWDAQLTQLPEIYWTVTSWPEGQSYEQVYNQAGQDFDARKRLRNFEPIKERGRKCTVCGERAALHREDETARAYWATIAVKVGEAKLRPDGKEQLCAVCAVKRFGELGQERFPSVSEMAAVPFKQAILQQLQGENVDLHAHSSLVTVLEQLTQALALSDTQTISQDVILALAKMLDDTLWKDLAGRILSYDGEWLFPETYERKLAEIGASSPQSQSMRQAKELVQKLADVAQHLGFTPPRPSPYYALLVADGDRMGKQIREAASEGPEKHIAISEALADFAGDQVYRIVQDKYAGRVVYAGGDDVMAFLPLPTALAAADGLRRAYAAKMAGLLETPTLSAGIAIAHHLSPLSEVLQAARQAEHAAKDEYDRNAIAVAFHKRGGAPVTMAAKWEFGDSQVSVGLLLDIQRRFAAVSDPDQKEQGLSLGVAHTLLEEARFLGGGVPEEARQAEVERLLYRAAPARLSKEVRQKQAKGLAPHLVQLAGAIEKHRNELDKVLCKPLDEPEPGLVIVAYWLLLLRFIVQETGMPVAGEEGGQ
jgi:CRISPR-associated protein Cmr2